MTDHTYEGWTGFGDNDSAWATWNAALWVDNDEGTYRFRMSFVEPGAWTRARAHEFFDEVFPKGTPDMERRDEDDGHMRSKDINFQELAEHWNAE